MSKEIKTAANGFANPVPKKDKAGLTAEEFADSLFKHSNCSERTLDQHGHTFLIGPFGMWFALCDNEPKEEVENI